MSTEIELIGMTRLFSLLLFVAFAASYTLGCKKLYSRAFLSLFVGTVIYTSYLSSGIYVSLTVTLLVLLVPLFVNLLAYPIKHYLKRGTEKQYGRFEADIWNGFFACYKHL